MSDETKCCQHPDSSHDAHGCFYQYNCDCKRRNLTPTSEPVVDRWARGAVNPSSTFLAPTLEPVRERCRIACNWQDSPHFTDQHTHLPTPTLASEQEGEKFQQMAEKFQQMAVEEHEAALCPEDVGCAELIAALREENERERKRAEGWHDRAVSVSEEWRAVAEKEIAEKTASLAAENALLVTELDNSRIAWVAENVRLSAEVERLRAIQRSTRVFVDKLRQWYPAIIAELEGK